MAWIKKPDRYRSVRGELARSPIFGWRYRLIIGGVYDKTFRARSETRVREKANDWFQTHYGPCAWRA